QSLYPFRDDLLVLAVCSIEQFRERSIAEVEIHSLPESRIYRTLIARQYALSEFPPTANCEDPRNPSRDHQSSRRPNRSPLSERCALDHRGHVRRPGRSGSARAEIERWPRYSENPPIAAPISRAVRHPPAADRSAFVRLYHALV